MDRRGWLGLAVAGAARRRQVFRSPVVRLNRTAARLNRAARRTGSAQPRTFVLKKTEPLNRTAPGRSEQQQALTAVAISLALRAQGSLERERYARICFAKARFASLFPPHGAHSVKIRSGIVRWYDWSQEREEVSSRGACQQPGD